MRILGIETSCDEAAVSLIEATADFGADFSYKIRGTGLMSQAALHAEYGGVFPNLAKREHINNLVPVLTIALKEAGELHERGGPSSIPLDALKEILAREAALYDQLAAFLQKYKKPDLDAIAVTYGPGLEPALWVGINFAKALAKAWDVPIVAVDHMEGHVVLPMMDEQGFKQFEFPVLALLISGGHTELILSHAWRKYERIGETRDDAVGEAFDKVARLLGLPYPGGPQIARLAYEARERSITPDFSFTRPMRNSGDYDFSFSGLKTAVRKLVEERSPLSEEMRLAIAREFEETVADVLVEKTIAAAEAHGADTVVVGGGVSANAYIRERLALRMMNASAGTRLLSPVPELATDNAIMIALAGYFSALQDDFADPTTLAAVGNLRLEK
ncbi:MAG: tRNA (adenosine(37)-N6)-threonylcarbamoyltransferase complex transferase subunit TsaD [Candidatus Kaiserbacteria bacterium]|nr:tRNA (adenosine(37)-N6)-threonylcarbamoyltransferase complex transferase subunit TsaD [Candidatus Kaiserbacteria bacterium]